MMKLVAIFALIAVCSAASIQKREADEPIAILKSDSDMQPDGSYTYSFESEDGTYREETGTLMNPGQEDAYVAMTGMYRYIDADGETVEVHYTADANGFVPSGSIIPDAIEQQARNANHE